MTTLSIQWIMPNDNANPADSVMNTWHFKTDDTGTPAEEATDCLAYLDQFYDGISPFLSSFLAGNWTAKVFDLSDPEPRVPVWEQAGSLGTLSGGNDLPCEIACCLSFQAERISGLPQARRRGRVYIGPLSLSAGALVPDESAGDMIVNSGFRASLASQAAQLAGVKIGGASGSAFAWCTFSQRTVDLGGTLAEASNNVTDGWIDVAVDIQRRRGHAPGTRTLWSD